MAKHEVWKFEVPVGAPVEHWIPGVMMGRGSLFVGNQRGTPCLWAVVDPSLERYPCQLQAIGTGHPVPEGAVYLGTAVGDPFVWHVFRLPMTAE